MRAFFKRVSGFYGRPALFSQIFFDNTVQKYIIRTAIVNRYMTAGAVYPGGFFKGDAELSALLLT
jgi:hypothetical protein